MNEVSSEVVPCCSPQIAGAWQVAGLLAPHLKQLAVLPRISMLYLYMGNSG
jgi:hypothetical protein